MPPTRVGHKKSRFGCIRCKHRHVKCDEQRPCGNCIRHDAECSLVLSTLSPIPPSATHVQSDRPRVPPTHSASEASGRSPDSPAVLPLPSHSHTPSAQPQQSNPIQPNLPASSIKAKVSTIRQALLELTDEIEVLEKRHSEPRESSSEVPSDSVSTADWLGDIELFHHFIQTGGLTLSSESLQKDMWIQVVPQLAFTRDSLMHGLLALSALHLAHTHPDRKREYMAQSARHQDIALSRLRTGMAEFTEHNCVEHFILAHLVMVFTFHSIANPSSPSSSSPLTIHDLGHSLFLGQGIMSIIASPSGWTWMRRSPLASLFHRPHPAPTAANLNEAASPFARRLAQLTDLAADMGGSPGEAKARAACLLACDGLRRAYGAALLSGHGSTQVTPVWMWLTLLPADFRWYVARAHPVALVVLAHYAALVRCFEDRWYLAGWSARVFGALDEAMLPEEADGRDWSAAAERQRWQAWLEFPRSFGAAELDEAVDEYRQREEERLQREQRQGWQGMEQEGEGSSVREGR